MLESANAAYEKPGTGQPAASARAADATVNITASKRVDLITDTVVRLRSVRIVHRVNNRLRLPGRTIANQRYWVIFSQITRLVFLLPV